ncbi:MAG: hypothetical protein ACXVAY_20560 [Mucilaginibacter sp.]
MKKTILFITLLIYTSISIAQDIINRKNRLTGSVTEKYQTVIKANKEEREGLYQAFYNGTLIASGQYKNNKRTGTWSFYNRKGEAEERYNYDTNILLAEAPEDSVSNFTYAFDGQFNKTDHGTKPVKIGGRYYGYVPYLKLFKLPADLQDIRREQFNVILELLVSPAGRLAEYKIHLKAVNFERVLRYDPDRIADDFKLFLPATVNNIPVTSRIFISCYINAVDDIDMD